MTAPHLVDAADLEQRADRIESRHDLPQLIRRLILATSSPKQLEFRAQEGIDYAGWDGFVDTKDPTPFVPKGMSVLMQARGTAVDIWSGHG